MVTTLTPPEHLRSGELEFAAVLDADMLAATRQSDARPASAVSSSEILYDERLNNIEQENRQLKQTLTDYEDMLIEASMGRMPLNIVDWQPRGARIITELIADAKDELVRLRNDALKFNGELRLLAKQKDHERADAVDQVRAQLFKSHNKVHALIQEARKNARERDKALSDLVEVTHERDEVKAAFRILEDACDEIATKTITLQADRDRLFAECEQLHQVIDDIGGLQHLSNVEQLPDIDERTAPIQEVPPPEEIGTPTALVPEPTSALCLDNHEDDSFMAIIARGACALASQNADGTLRSRRKYSDRQLLGSMVFAKALAIEARDVALVLKQDPLIAQILGFDRVVPGRDTLSAFANRAPAVGKLIPQMAQKLWDDLPCSCLRRLHSELRELGTKPKRKGVAQRRKSA